MVLASFKSCQSQVIFASLLKTDSGKDAAPIQEVGSVLKQHALTTSHGTGLSVPQGRQQDGPAPPPPHSRTGFIWLEFTETERRTHER